MTTRQATRFPRTSTIDAVARGVDEYRARHGIDVNGPVSLGPLDAYLLHLVQEFTPRPFSIIDQAAWTTEGASAAVSLANGSAARIIIPSQPTTRGTSRETMIEDLVTFAADWGTGLHTPKTRLEGSEARWPEVLESVPTRESALLVMSSCDEMDALVAALEAHPRHAAVVLNLGRFGACRSLRDLLIGCREGGRCRPRLFRELAPGLQSSGVALIAAGDHAFAPLIVERIGHLFNTNHDFLSLVRDASLYHVERGTVVLAHREVSELEAKNQDMKNWIAELEKHQKGLNRRIEELMEESARARSDRHAAEAALHHECTRGLGRTLVLQTGRRLASFGRRNRVWLAPPGGLRDRLAKALMRRQRALRGKSGPSPLAA